MISIKRILVTVVSVCMLAFSSTNLAAFDHTYSSGSAIVPKWVRAGSEGCDIFVTNITNREIKVFITFYDTAGNIYNESTESGQQFYFYEMTGDPTSNAGAILPPHQSGQIYQPSGLGTGRHGYAVIRWESTSPDRMPVALIAHYNGTWGSSMFYYTINEGKPF